jgi:DNA-binding NarL/FixJ family response regulator
MQAPAANAPDDSNLMMNSPVRVLVVDDHPFFREGLVMWIHRQPQLECCGQAETLAEARKAIQELKPDLILLDLQLKDGDGLDLLRKPPGGEPLPHTIVVSQRDESLYAERALRAGAHGYVMKDEATTTVLQAIQTVAAGGVYVSPAVNRHLLSRFTSPASRAKGLLPQLSHRELQVYRMLGEGRSAKAIAVDLGISSKTVDSYRESLKQKLGLPDSVAVLQHATLWVQEVQSNPALGQAGKSL